MVPKFLQLSLFILFSLVPLFAPRLSDIISVWFFNKSKIKLSIVLRKITENSHLLEVAGDTKGLKLQGVLTVTQLHRSLNPGWKQTHPPGLSSQTGTSWPPVCSPWIFLRMGDSLQQSLYFTVRVNPEESTGCLRAHGDL